MEQAFLYCDCIYVFCHAYRGAYFIWSYECRNGQRACFGASLGAGPALSLPSMLVIRSIMGTKKTVVYVSLVVIMATISGMVFGWSIK